MAGAASLQRDRDREVNSQSELSQIAAGYKMPNSTNNQVQVNNNGFGLLALKKDFLGKNSINNTSDLHSIPSTRLRGKYNSNTGG